MANPNPQMADAVDRLIELAGHTEIVKHVPGQIHLKVKPRGIVIALNILNVIDLKVSLRGILGANVSGRSIVIDYDEKAIPKELWELLIKSHANPKIQQLVKRELLSRMQA
jgi:hypothetical protein